MRVAESACVGVCGCAGKSDVRLRGGKILWKGESVCWLKAVKEGGERDLKRWRGVLWEILILFVLWQISFTFYPIGAPEIFSLHTLSHTLTRTSLSLFLSLSHTHAQTSSAVGQPVDIIPVEIFSCPHGFGVGSLDRTLYSRGSIRTLNHESWLFLETEPVTFNFKFSTVSIKLKTDNWRCVCLLLS